MVRLVEAGSAVAVAEQAAAAAAWLGVLAQEADALGAEGSNEFWATEEG
jgi:hypothetical protein